MDSKIAQRGNSLRQEAFAAGFINRRSPGVENNGSKSSLICRDRRGDSRRPSSNDDDVGVCVHEKSYVLLSWDARCWGKVVLGIRCEMNPVASETGKNYFSCNKTARAFFKSPRFFLST